MKLRTIIKEATRAKTQETKLLQLFVKDLFRRKFTIGYDMFALNGSDEAYSYLGTDEFTSTVAGATLTKNEFNSNKVLTIYFPDPDWDGKKDKYDGFNKFDSDSEEDIASSIQNILENYGLMNSVVNHLALEFDSEGGKNWYKKKYTILNVRNENVNESN